MENLTHSLVGAIIADAALDAPATKRIRRVFLATGVVAANAPDLDLLYTSITPMPIGYLLHHRGHTHTVAGLMGLFAVIALVAWAARAMSRREPLPPGRLAVVIAAGLLSHLLLDGANAYGVHPFFPIDNRWYYGDTFFLFEPWLWLSLLAAAAANATTLAGRALAFAALAALPAAAVLVGLVPWEAMIVAAAVILGAGWRLRHRPAASRAAAALVACGLAAMVMGLTSRYARSEALAVLATPPASRLLDVVMTPNPSFPVCWAVIAVETDAQDNLVVRRGSLSLLPFWRAAAMCPLNVLATPRLQQAIGPGFVWLDGYRVSREDLRAAASDCRAAAWLRFARAPVFENGRLFDLRFENETRGNFTSMRHRPGERSACPDHVPQWTMPRADALTSGR